MLILAVFLLAGFVKGVIGLGLPTIAMALLSLAMPPAAAAGAVSATQAAPSAGGGSAAVKPIGLEKDYGHVL